MDTLDPARLVAFRLLAGSLYPAFVSTMEAWKVSKMEPDRNISYHTFVTEIVDTFVRAMVDKGCEMDTNQLSHLIIDAILLYTRGER